MVLVSGVEVLLWCLVPGAWCLVPADADRPPQMLPMLHRGQPHDVS